MNVTQLLQELSAARGLSGYEGGARAVLERRWREYADEVWTDKVGSLIALQRGQRGDHKAMIATHIDEIGLIVSRVSDGAIGITEVGGIDKRQMPGQLVTVHGRRDLPGIIASRPPHVLPAEMRERYLPLEQLYVDVGLPADEVDQLVRVGDLVSFDRQASELLNGRLSGKAFDNRASVAAATVCLQQLGTRHHAWDVVAVATVQEETTFLGATTSAFALQPDLAIAIDVTFARGPGISESFYMDMDGGPVIALGPNIHPRIYEALVETAREMEMDRQLEPIPGHSGTDAWPIQVSQSGIPTGLVSIPLRYMHSTVETIAVKDVERVGRLLAAFLAGLTDDFFKEA